MTPAFLDPNSIIEQGAYIAAATNWQQISHQLSQHDALLASFGGGTRMSSVNFTVPQVIEVLSAVGIDTVKARFLITIRNAQYCFRVALYATATQPDGEEQVLSSYYLSDYWTDSVPFTSTSDMEVADVLRNHWAASWADTAQYPLEPSLFVGPWGQLVGYNFTVKDFMESLEGLGKDDVMTQRVQLVLGLRTYFAPNPVAEGHTTAAVFGVAVQVTGAASRPGSADISYDMAGPCPPGH